MSTRGLRKGQYKPRVIQQTKQQVDPQDKLKAFVINCPNQFKSYYS
jgi:hypothetical protein